jgi:hypothetical protein
MQTHQPPEYTPYKGVLCRAVYFVYLVVKLPPVPADGLPEELTDVADVFNLAMLVFNSDWFCLL